MSNIKDFFGNSRILITGSSGFVGRNLFNKLKEEGLNVTGTYFSKPIKDMIYCDLTNKSEVEKLVKDFDYVFMFATKTYGAGVVKENPCALVGDNLILNSTTLDACYRAKVKKVMYISSSTVYQESSHYLAEDDLDLNKDPFLLYDGVGWVKRYTEKLCKFYNRLGLNICIVRPTNIFGPFDKYEEGKSHFIPAVTKRIIEKQNPLIIWGKGNTIKNLIYVDDFNRDMLKVFMNHNKVDPINICSNDYYSIKQIVNSILSINNYYPEIIYDSTKPDAIPFRGLNRNKFDSLFGIEEYTTLEGGLSKVVGWLKKELKYE